MSKFMDGVVSINKELPLITTKRLLRKLDVHTKSTSEQSEAISIWLEENTPNRILRRSLYISGFINE